MTTRQSSGEEPRPCVQGFCATSLGSLRLHKMTASLDPAARGEACALARGHARWMRHLRGACVGLLAALLTACSTSKRGGYYQNDGPARTPANVAAIPDAVPRVEPFAPANLRPYVIAGQRYAPIADNRGFRQEGLASWYGRQFHGKRTANGEIYDMNAMTAAHPILPIPSYARVTRKSTGRSVIVRINDRGPFHSSRIIDLSYAAAAKLDLIAPGTGTVIVEAISHDQIRAGVAPTAPTTPAASAGQRIFLQFGAFSIADYAYRLANRLQTVQQDAVVQRGADGLYRVLTGPYPVREEALAAARAIGARIGLPAAIALH